jgi:hypothetical protein
MNPTPYLPTLKSLLARVEGATGADRELDLALGLAIGGWKLVPDPTGLTEDEFVDCGDLTCPATPGASYEAITESLDSALALCERVLPGCGIDIGLYPAEPPGRPTPLAEATMRACDSGHPFVAVRPCFAPTAALALLAALLKALISQE